MKKSLKILLALYFALTCSSCQDSINLEDSYIKTMPNEFTSDSVSLSFYQRTLSGKDTTRIFWDTQIIKSVASVDTSTKPAKLNLDILVRRNQSDTSGNTLRERIKEYHIYGEGLDSSKSPLVYKPRIKSQIILEDRENNLFPTYADSSYKYTFSTRDSIDSFGNGRMTARIVLEAPYLGAKPQKYFLFFVGEITVFYHTK
jgi:hypothetical protein